jgi:hypothetical protein
VRGRGDQRATRETSTHVRRSTTQRRPFGYHPIFGFLDNTNEALAGILRPGNAGSNTATDHIAVLDACLAQIPDPHRYGQPVLVRADTASSSSQFLACISPLSRPVPGRDSGAAMT